MNRGQVSLCLPILFYLILLSANSRLCSCALQTFRNCEICSISWTVWRIRLANEQVASQDICCSYSISHRDAYHSPEKIQISEDKDYVLTRGKKTTLLILRCLQWTIFNSFSLCSVLLVQTIPHVHGPNIYIYNLYIYI